MEKKLSKKQKELLREFVSFNCESCGKNESEVGTLEIHRIKQMGEYYLRNLKLVCKKCHSYFSSAQNIAIGVSS
jgi:ribosomal protein L44E